MQLANAVKANYHTRTFQGLACLLGTAILINNSFVLKGVFLSLRQFLANESLLKNYEKYFLVHLKSFFRSQDT